MAKTFVTSANPNTGGNATSYTFTTATSLGSTPATGDLVVVSIQRAAASAITPPSGDSWAGIVVNGGTAGSSAIYWRQITGSESSTYQWSWGTNTGTSVVVAQFHDPSGGTWIPDKTIFFTGSGTSSSSLAAATYGTTGTLVSSDEAVFGNLALSGTSGTATPTITGLTLLNGSNRFAIEGYTIASATTAISPAWSWTTARTKQSGLLVTFRTFTGNWLPQATAWWVAKQHSSGDLIDQGSGGHTMADAGTITYSNDSSYYVAQTTNGANGTLTATDHADFQPGAGDFTLITVIKPSLLSGTLLWTQRFGATGYEVYSQGTSAKADVYNGTDSLTVSGPSALSTNTRYVVAVVRNGNQTRVVVDGTSGTAATITAPSATVGAGSSSFWFGSGADASTPSANLFGIAWFKGVPLTDAQTVTVGNELLANDLTVVATVAAPLGALTMTVAATPDAMPTVAASLGSLTATASALPAVGATVDTSLGSLSVTAAATPTVNATVDVPLGSVAVASTATPDPCPTASVPLGGLTVVTAATPDPSPTVAAPLGGLTTAASATSEHPATVMAVLGGLVVTASAVPEASASVDASLGALTATATAGAEHLASVDVPLGELTLTTSADMAHDATVDAPLGSLTVTAASTVTTPQVNATVDAPLGGLGLTVAAGVEHPATVAVPLGELTVGASTGVTHPAQVQALLGALSLVVSAAVEHQATIDAPLGPLSLAIAATVTRLAVVEILLGPLNVTARARIPKPETVLLVHGSTDADNRRTDDLDGNHTTSTDGQRSTNTDARRTSVVDGRRTTTL